MDLLLPSFHFLSRRQREQGCSFSSAFLLCIIRICSSAIERQEYYLVSMKSVRRPIAHLVQESVEKSGGEWSRCCGGCQNTVCTFSSQFGEHCSLVILALLSDCLKCCYAHTHKKERRLVSDMPAFTSFPASSFLPFLWTILPPAPVLLHTASDCHLPSISRSFSFVKERRLNLVPQTNMIGVRLSTRRTGRHCLRLLGAWVDRQSLLCLPLPLWESITPWSETNDLSSG